VGALAVLSVCLFNGFPLVYSDTGTYLRSAFTGYVPDDRPYWYGLFVQFTSFNGTTLWGVVAAQALLCSTLLWRCWRVFGDGRAWTFLLTITILAPLTGLGWYAGQLVADIFSVIGVLAGLLFLLAPARRYERIAWAALMVIACWVHLSNLLILPLVLGAVVIARKMAKEPTPFRRTIAAAAILIAAWPGLMLANKAVSGEAYVSRYSHVFLMSRLAETGILHTWIAEHCPDARYGICQFADSIPTTNKAFMWGDRSPLRWQGGPKAVKDEYQAIINSTLGEPRYIGLHIAGSLRSTWDLLQLWRVADELEGTFYRQDYSAPYISLHEFLPGQLDAFLRSAQNTGEGKLGLARIDPVYQVIMGLSLLATLVLMIHPGYRHRCYVPLTVGLVTMLAGAWVCATLSTVDSRFMARTAWLLPWMVAMLAWTLTAHRNVTGPEVAKKVD